MPRTPSIGLVAPDAAPPPGDGPGVRIYCRVVDNFGDAGVTWRLARQLAHERGCTVTLVIDAPQVLARLLGDCAGAAMLAGLAAGGGAGSCDGIALEAWPGRAAGLLPGTDLVIAAFGCELPAPVRAALAPGDPAPPCWVNLEYLSAEAWVEGTHGLPSIKPADGAIEWFVKPGFGPRTGGLLRERGLFEARDAHAREGRAGPWLAALGVPDAGSAMRVSLFCYPHAPLAALLDEAARSTEPSQWLVPPGVAGAALQAWAGAAPAPGETRVRGAVQLVGLPWLPQPDYDRLLWSCDLNFVRGEDSWVRAIWAARPFVWQPYRQEGGAHRIKLDAFLDRLLDGAQAADSAVLRAVHHRWLDATADCGAAPARPRGDQARSGADPAAGAAAGVDVDPAATWDALVACARAPAWQRHLRDFAERSARVPDLASTLLAIAAREGGVRRGQSTDEAPIG